MAMTAIAGALSALKSTGDVFKALLDIKVSSEVYAKIIDLNRTIFAATQDALAAQADQAELSSRISELEQEIVRMTQWGAERENYELADLGGGATAYIVKPLMQGTQAPHWLCTNCYQEHRKSILQPQGHRDGDRTWLCPACKATINVAYSQTPTEHARSSKWKRLGPGDQCPRCRQKTFRTQRTEKPLDEGLAMIGIKIHHMKCDNCEFEDERQVAE